MILGIVKNNLQKCFIILIITLQSTISISFEITDENINRATQEYYL